MDANPSALGTANCSAHSGTHRTTMEAAENRRKIHHEGRTSIRPPSLLRSYGGLLSAGFEHEEKNEAGWQTL